MDTTTYMKILSKSQLHPYQTKAINFIQQYPKCGLFLDLGLGKTISTLTAITDLFASGEISKVLVIAPLRVALSTWQQEIARWQHTQHLTSTQLCGAAGDRFERMLEPTQIHIINRELIGWIVNILNLESWPYEMVIIDESASFKNPKTQRFKAMKQVLPYIKRLVLLSGTPISNGLQDLWSQLYLLDEGKRLSKSYYRFVDTYFETNIFGGVVAPLSGAEAHIKSSIADICMSMQADDYLNMPESITLDYTFTMDRRTKLAYDTLKRDFFLNVGEAQITSANAAALINKLKQFCNGAVYVLDNEGRQTNKYNLLHDKKLELLAEIIETLNGAPVLVAYSYQSDKERILKAFPQAEALDKDPNTIERWNQGAIPILIAHPASCGHGLNLQHGGNHIVWMGLPWSLELYNQMNARLHRQGQTKAVVIHHLLANDTVDALVGEQLSRKRITLNSLITALKPK